jgi:hypothetical protein
VWGEQGHWHGRLAPLSNATLTPCCLPALPAVALQQMREVNKGIGVDNLHYLNDGLWKTPALA